MLSIERLKESKSDVMVVFDEKEAIALYNELADETPLLICIDPKSMLTPPHSNLQMINCYHRCSTRLYNILHQYAQTMDDGSCEVNYFDGKGIRVLVAEDNEVNQMLIKELLDKYSVTTVVVDNGEEALSCAKEYRFDLILMDINMPVMNGLEMVKKIREHEAYKFIPIVMLTTETKPELKELANQYGAKAWLLKPFNKVFLNPSKI